MHIGGVQVPPTHIANKCITTCRQLRRLGDVATAGLGSMDVDTRPAVLQRLIFATHQKERRPTRIEEDATQPGIHQQLRLYQLMNKLMALWRSTISVKRTAQLRLSHVRPFLKGVRSAARLLAGTQGLDGSSYH